MIGKGPHDPTIGYPEHDHHKKVGDLASSVSVWKECFVNAMLKIKLKYKLYTMDKLF